MAWRIEFDPAAVKELDGLDTQSARRIAKFILERLAPLDNPRTLGEALKGSKFGTLWKYRVGDFRIIADIQDGMMVVLVVRVGNRRNVYKR